MNLLNQAPQPAKRVGIGKRISDVWNSRNRLARLLILVTTGLVLNCCCVIIPLSGQANSPAAQANIAINSISSSALTTAQDRFMPAALAISANTEFDTDGNGREACKDFSSQAAAREVPGVSSLQLDGSHKHGRSCRSLP
jgi:hypothetical protein